MGLAFLRLIKESYQSVLNGFPFTFLTRLLHFANQCKVQSIPNVLERSILQSVLNVFRSPGNVDCGPQELMNVLRNSDSVCWVVIHSRGGPLLLLFPFMRTPDYDPIGHFSVYVIQ